ncbi:MAG: response regulator [Beijerinckiaceae bacterium]|nr:response regulator [Beijerinckiaceae bacterium]
MPSAQIAEGSANADAGADRVLTILAVDDDPLVLMSTGAMIEDLGHVVIEANSGAQALEILRGDAKIDLVITDQSMPEMTGVQLAQSMQSERPGVPVVLATGYSDLPPGSPQLPMIGKPFNENDLARAIKNAMSRT